MAKVSPKKSSILSKPWAIFLCVVFLGIGILVGIFIAKKEAFFVSLQVNQQPEYLFLQEAESGSFTPLHGKTREYTLTLKNYNARTLFFADRPKRLVGSMDTNAFITTNWKQGENSFQKNPPNAALTVFNADSNHDDTIVLELSDPIYDASLQTLSYSAKVIDPTSSSQITVKNPILVTNFPTTFEKPTLYIDMNAIMTIHDFELPIGYRDPLQVYPMGHMREP